MGFTEINDKTSDPIRVCDFRPVQCDTLVRIGSPNDGGYVVPLDAVKSAHALLSFGLSHDWDFERDFKKHNPGALVHCYDHTVSLLTAFLYSLGQLARFVLFARIRSLRRSLTWIDYKLFFRKDKIHFKQRIWRDEQNNSMTIDGAFSRLPADAQVFVKMDIEGGEYRVLDDLLRYSQNIPSMAIEFHDVDILSSLFSSLIAKIKQDFHIVHIHANNMGGTAFNFPMSPEITFLNKRLFSDPDPPASGMTYPLPGLDNPNHPRFPDFVFKF